MRGRLNKALTDYKKGIKCPCGNDIWVIGFATLWNSCLLCLTCYYEEYPDEDYLCVLKRLSQEGSGEFYCSNYKILFKST